jgi:hypothetical protein
MAMISHPMDGGFSSLALMRGPLPTRQETIVLVLIIGILSQLLPWHHPPGEVS